MDKPKLNKLSQEVINQIAAGEVVERPSSVVKELLDNSIDADSSKIVIKIKNGGIDLIEISDNGIGIPKESMTSIFDPHTTSKISNIEDLNTLLSMGFRGEALSTISSVSNVTLLSKYREEETGYKILFNENGKSPVKKVAKEDGTTVKIENIFYNIPARQKYLKSPQTEYRKIHELLNSYFLIYPNIHFVLEKDGKIVKELPQVLNTKPGDIVEKRLNEIVGESSSFLMLYYEGSGIKISGYTAHPSNHKSSNPKTYIFVNNRPIYDKGIVRAIYEGYSRYIPHGQKIDFAINILINPELVDINVHPRKEEVRFENPFRIYSAIEDAVRHVLSKELSYKETPSTNNFAAIRESFAKQSSNSKLYEPTNIYNSNKSASVQDTLLFSKELLTDIPEDTQLPWEEGQEIVNIFQIFKKYIVIEFIDEKLWMIDQHAAAERINFESLSKGKDNIDVQNYLVAVELNLKDEEILFLEEHIDFFKNIGILYEIKKNKLILKTVPVEFVNSDFKKVFEEIFSLEEDIELLKKNFKKLRDDILATISCHNSIRSGQRLQKEEMLDIYNKLMDCQNPYSCPHGRPAVWKLSLSEIDSNFERTY
ncbi:MAG: DNA mismatch repair endonuclease MutL [Candidatus Dojkabacteria bacterium]|jgi:DNA mismatch repair protein MutL|nr:DNA mismatch repair endonuclease MutL [Candidatus Dojkabacteria bacterium]MDD4561187.1 DNA mismatch repair endonuclease MutL [Candidatus Dojkabacteria bacterium]